MLRIASCLLSLCGSTWALGDVLRSQYPDDLCLAVNSEAESGWRFNRNVEVGTCAGDNHQQLTLTPVVLETGDTIVTIEALGQCFDIDAEGVEPWTINSNVQINPCNGSIRQQFEQVPQGDGWFSLRSRWDGRCLDIDMNSANAWRTGRNIHLWTCHGEPNQLWNEWLPAPLPNPGPVP